MRSAILTALAIAGTNLARAIDRAATRVMALSRALKGTCTRDGRVVMPGERYCTECLLLASQLRGLPGPRQARGVK